MRRTARAEFDYMFVGNEIYIEADLSGDWERDKQTGWLDGEWTEIELTVVEPYSGNDISSDLDRLFLPLAIGQKHALSVLDEIKMMAREKAEFND